MDPRTNPAPTTRRPPAPRPAPAPARRVPDGDIIAMRRMSEVERMPLQAIMRAYPQYSRDYITKVLEYVLRAGVKGNAP